MDYEPHVPNDATYVRTTVRFSPHTAPAGLLRAHQVAPGVWGRLLVDEGEVGFAFEDDGEERLLTAGDSIGIPPGRPHHVVPREDAIFAVEFYREATSATRTMLAEGDESTGLRD